MRTSRTPLTFARIVTLALMLLMVGCGGRGGEGQGDVGAPDAAGDVGPDALDDAAAPDSGDDASPDSGGRDASGADAQDDATSDADSTDSDATDTDADGIDPDASDPDGADAPDVARPDVADTGGATGRLNVIDVDPAHGPTAGGTPIVVFGSGFTWDTDIYINNVLAEDIDVVDGTTILARTPPNPEGTYSVKVVNADADAALPGAFTYFAPLDVTAVAPARGPERGGAPLVVTGSGFTPDSVVSVGGQLGIGIAVVDRQTIELLAPAGIAGPADVRVTNTTGSVVLRDAYTYYAEPRIDALEPAFGPAAGGTTVQLFGAGFTASTRVRFGMAEAEVLAVEAGTITVRTPLSTPGFADVTVDAGANGSATREDGFYYFGGSGTALALEAVVPASGSVDGGEQVTLVGSGLAEATAVFFGDAEATIVTASESAVIARTPAGAAGVVDVRVVGEADVEATLEGGFRYVEPLMIAEVVPAFGQAAGGDVVTVHGRGFDAATRVSFGPLAGTDLQRVSASELRVTTPPGSVGPVDVTVRRGAASDVLEDGFVYGVAAAVGTFSPSRGSVAGNTFVVIRGAGFVGDVRVFFGDQEAPEVTVVDSATLEVRTPPNPPGRAAVAVQVGEQTVTAADQFLYFDPNSDAGGWWGDGIIGAVNVTVRDANSGEPIEEAFVTLSVRADETAYTGWTDARGQVTLSGPDLSGAQSVHATALKYSSATVNSLNAENVTVFLSYICPCFTTDNCPTGESCISYAMTNVCRAPEACSAASDCSEPGYVCAQGRCTEKCWCGCASDGECFGGQSCNLLYGLCETSFSCEADADCARHGNFQCLDGVCTENCDPPPGPPTGTISGRLTGMSKIDDPGPSEQIVGVVFTTTPDPFSGNPPPGGGNQTVGDGPYTLVSRLGNVAVLGFCGVLDSATGDFRPLWLAVRRYLNVRQGESYTVDLECNIPLDRTLRFKLLDPPLAAVGAPDINQVIPYLDFGPEGAFGGLVVAQGRTSVLEAEGFPRLEGVLSDVDYFIYGGSVPSSNPGGIPFSVSMLWDVTEIDELITLPALVPPAQLTEPGEYGTLRQRRVEWELDNAVQPDFYYATIQDTTQQTTFWEVWLPGDESGFNLPFFPPGTEVGPLPSGPLVLIVFSVDARAFDYGNFEYNDFSIANWESYSANGWVIFNP